MSIRVSINEHPRRAIALSTPTHALVLRHSAPSTDTHNPHSTHHNNASSTSLGSAASPAARCMVEFARLDDVDLSDFRTLHSVTAHGTLGLITVDGHVFLVVVNAATKVATVRPGESVQRIMSVGFHCLTTSQYDALLADDINPYSAAPESNDDEAYDRSTLEHPCLALKKLLSSGTFYYSADFDLTRRLQSRASDAATVSIDSLDAGFLWNSYMIQPLVDFRSRLAPRQKDALDASGILTSAIRGFAGTITLPGASAPIKARGSGMPSTMTLISRLSCRRAGTRFNSRGIDDDGNVANFVESETIYWSPSGVCFSYAQIRGSVPIFWEQQTGLLPGQQKITITRSPEATQPAFDKHFENMELSYGAMHVVNLLSNEKPNEMELTNRYRDHIRSSPLNRGNERTDREHELIKLTEYDFHAETRGPGGYEMASMIARWIQDSADSFAYYLTEDVEEVVNANGQDRVMRRTTPVLEQEGAFRTNCLDCLDRTNLVQTIISKMALDLFFSHRGLSGSQDFWTRHSSLWADNGDALSRIYAGTGALKSSFTRHGKMSLAGALADARKSVTRTYINNFADKGRQNTIDMLLGRLMGQVPVHLYDPINDFVMAELVRRAPEYSETEVINILVGTFNLNGKTTGMDHDLSPWLCPQVDPSQQCPEIVAVGFQEIVELSPQQIMSTEPTRRQDWEHAVKRCLDGNAEKHGRDEYVMLRGGQLVGASLSVFVRADCLKNIKNVEGSLKKTGMSGMAGNKGAVAIRMEYANTSICLVTAHLAAGFANYEERNRDYKTISHGLRFQRNRSIEDHDTVIWLGDFNYRIGLSNDKVQRLCQMNDLETLYDNDQLNLQMVAGLTFPFYSEARITFLPTYKYDLGTDTYDTSEKARIPAWCDRVLRKGDNIRQIHYDAAPLKFSDHRPVYATFQVRVQKVDDRAKDALKDALYTQRRSVVGDTHAAGHGAVDSSDDDLLGYESVEPGLPPASSDRRKWWLDNGLPAKSRVAPPSTDHKYNANRTSNPFTPSPEPDWISVSKPPRPEPPPARGAARARTIDFNNPPPPQNPAARRMIVPSYDGASGSGSGLHRAASAASTRSLPVLPSRKMPPPYMPHSNVYGVQNTPTGTSASGGGSGGPNVLRKPAPPIPSKKPSLVGRTTLLGDHERYRDDVDDADFHAPTRSRAKPPANANVSRKPVPNLIDADMGGEGGEGAAPPLPPRRSGGRGGGMNLLDVLDDEGFARPVDAEGWEVLRPGR